MIGFSGFNRAARRFAVLAFSVLATVAGAQDYPAKPIRVVVPYPPGAGPDFVARLLAQRIGPMTGQSVVVENRAGSGGVPAILEMMRSPADGYTVFASDQGHWSIYPAMNSNAAYDPQRDFAPVSLVLYAVQFIVSRTSFPAKDLGELIARARAVPGEVRYSSYGVGGLAHLTVEAFASDLGLKLLHAPYPGGVPAMEAVLRGDVDFSVLSIGQFQPHVHSGKLRPIAVVTPPRHKALPNVPTIAEAAPLPGFEFPAVAGWVLRAGTPRPLVDRLSALVAKAEQSQEVIEKMEGFGFEARYSTPEQMAEQMRSDYRKMARIVRALGIASQ